MNFTSTLTLFPLISALYFPPLYVYAGQKFLRRFEWLTYPALTFPVGALISGLLYVNYQAPGFIITYLIFILFNVIGYFRKINRVTSFSLAIYASFAISELWEWPIHLYNWNNVHLYNWRNDYLFENGLIFFSLKIIALIFFFQVILKSGWWPSPGWLLWFSLTFACGAFMFTMMPDIPLNYNPAEYLGLYLSIHCYRLPWIILFAWCII